MFKYNILSINNINISLLFKYYQYVYILITLSINKSFNEGILIILTAYLKPSSLFSAFILHKINKLKNYYLIA